MLISHLYFFEISVQFYGPLFFFFFWFGCFLGVYFLEFFVYSKYLILYQMHSWHSVS